MALKVVLAEPEGTDTEEGTVSAALLSEIATVVAETIDWFSVTVQVLMPPDRTVEGLQEREEMARGGNRVSEAVWELVPRVAVTTAVCVLVMPAAVAVKVADKLPTGTITEEGTERRELLSLNPIEVLTEGA